jgi:drug/metabolite transporter (DMT)-like permease
LNKAGAERRILGLDSRQIAFVLLFVAPALFAANMLVAKATADTIPPVALAFWRWTVALIVLAPFTAGALWRQRRAIRREWRDIIVLGALGMGVCGAFVYIGADTTTATNIGLIYAAAPILIVVLARAVYGEALGALQAFGVVLSLVGVIAIVCRGDIAVLLSVSFAVGDIWILGATAGWAVYATLLRHRPSALAPTARFAAIILGGIAVLLPFTVAEGVGGALPVLDWTTVAAVMTVAILPSLGAYQAYARSQMVLGAGPTSLVMYLIPIYNSVLAFLLLGEALETYHLIGAALVLPGIYLATRSAARKPPPSAP